MIPTEIHESDRVESEALHPMEDECVRCHLHDDRGPARKVAAVGIRVAQGVTMHGFALNVSTDLEMFEGIVPCGIADRWVTSLEAETGASPSLEEMAYRAAVHLARALERDLVWTQSDALMGSGGVDIAAAVAGAHG
jgi:lipoate-protein ligase B